MEICQFLEQQSKQYQSHLEKQNRLKTAIRYQHQIKTTKIIPRQYKPKILKPLSNSRQNILKHEFETEFNTLFLRHLEKVMTQNQVSLELENGALQSIIAQTIQHISQQDKPQGEIQKLCDQFLYINNITEDSLPVELRIKIQKSRTPAETTPPSIKPSKTSVPASTPSSAPPSPIGTPKKTEQKNRKRKCSTQPPPIKKSKQHFLDAGQPIPKPRT